MDTLADIWWESYKQFHHCEGNRKDIDLFLTSELTKEQLDLYKLWLESKEFSLIPSEFMVRLLGFDKISAIVVPPTIMTTSSTPHVKYFNYYIMDWKIKLISPQEYNYKRAIFEEVPRSLIAPDIDREYEEEIGKIKAKVLKKDRHQFLK